MQMKSEGNWRSEGVDAMRGEKKGQGSRRTGRTAGLPGIAALLWGLAMLVPALLVPAVWADDDGGNTDSAPPARAVRLSYVEGDVHLYQGEQQLADQALANTPLFEGMRVDTGNDGRAEIQFEDGSVARLSPETSLTLSVLQGLSANAERNAEMVLNGGLAYFELQGESDTNHMKVRFGESEVTANGFTVLRINADKPPGEVAVFSGNAHLEGGSGPTLDLHGGESLALNASDPGDYVLAETIEPDSWDAWNSDRDQDLNAAQGERTEASENQPDSQNPAWSDLDANGNWYNVPDQGYVWSPNDASNPNWDPYGNGYWMDTPGYGYMWISGYPWGYLPYQCGAWNFYPSFGWGWAPGGGCNPWWGGGGGWIFNIGYAPPRYRYPDRPHPVRPRNPRAFEDHRPIARPVIPVHRNVPTVLGNTVLRPRDGTATIAGNVVTPLKPVGPPRLPNTHPVPVFGVRPSPNQPTGGSAPGQVFRNEGNPRAIPTPARPGTVYTPPSRPGAVYTGPSRPGPVYTPSQPRVNPAPQPRIAPVPQPRPYTPAPPPRTYTPPPRSYTPPPAPRAAPPPVHSAPPPAAHPGGGAGGRPAGPHR